MERPGLLYVAATLLPLAASAILAIAGVLRQMARPRADGGNARLYQLLGGARPGHLGAYVATGSIALACVLSIIGLIAYRGDPDPTRWQGHVTWAAVGSGTGSATHLDLGYHIDALTAYLFVMITLVSTLIFLFSIGYMSEELDTDLTDHELPDAGHGHYHRRGRFGRFFLFLALFCFSMLNLVLADNLLQVFVSWELVGVCSYLLIGFYTERPAAANAAVKAFVVNRIGDAGFIVGMCILWSVTGTLNIRALAELVHSGVLSGELLTIAGLGLFLGCVGKSAQFPLHVWLPDAMEGPTPVSALIHAATMVAAGVYLVGRVFFIFTPEALLVIAYTGTITLFGAALIALVQTDIKRVLAYSTVSQLGYMMLGLGVGGWVAGELHLLTHAFFKALLFLASGSVIYACHHVQDLRKMGGLIHKLPITGWTTLIGVLAISGTPFFSGWYSKDLILTEARGFTVTHPQHFLLFDLPLVTAGLTACYMLRMWFLAFTGRPRDEQVYEHAHESPWVMTVPLVVLAAFSLGVAWGWPPWKADASWLAGQLRQAQPAAAMAQFAEAKHAAEAGHLIAGALALLAAVLGALLAAALYWRPAPGLVRALVLLRPLARVLEHKFYLDELYRAVFVRGTVDVAIGCREFDKSPSDDATRPDFRTLDGWANLPAAALWAFGRGLRTLQTGSLRTYVLALALTAVVLFAILSILAGRTAAG